MVSSPYSEVLTVCYPPLQPPRGLFPWPLWMPPIPEILLLQLLLQQPLWLSYNSQMNQEIALWVLLRRPPYSLTTGVHQHILVLPWWLATTAFWPQILASAFMIEDLNMVHSNSVLFWGCRCYRDIFPFLLLTLYTCWTTYTPYGVLWLWLELQVTYSLLSSLLLSLTLLSAYLYVNSTLFYWMLQSSVVCVRPIRYCIVYYTVCD